MKKWIMPLLLGLALTQSANASKLFYCKYFVYENAPFADVSVGISEDHHLDSFVTVIEVGGATHHETATLMPTGNGELFHLAISKENPDNLIYMLIYNKTSDESETTADSTLGLTSEITDDTYKSTLINPAMPAAYQNIYGTCTLQ